jgi:glycosyltransferase involved in cell wall biosynthesis
LTERSVLMVCASLGVGGAERQWSLLAPRLAEHGLLPTVLTLRAKGRFYDEVAASGVRMLFADMRSPFDPRGLRRALASARERPDLVLSHSANAQVVGHAIAVRTGRPHLTTEHRAPGMPRRPHHRAALRLIAPRVDLVFAVSSAQIPDLVKLGYRRERIRVVPNGVPAPSAGAERDVTRRRLGVPEDAFVALLAAALRPEKAVDVFLRGVAAANARDPRIRGLVAGAGPEEPRLAALIAKLDGAVRLLGDRADVPELIGAADVVCLSSAYEGLPMVLLEAMALARPIVATAVGGIPELVGEDAGLLVRPGDAPALADALVELASDPARSVALGDAGRRRHRERYALEPMIEAYVEALRDVLAAREGTRA